MKQIKLTAKIIDSKGIFALKIPDDYKAAIQELLKYCNEKRGGFASFSISAPSKPGTNPQNNAFHALLEEFYKSGLHSFNSNMELRYNMMTKRNTQCQDKSSWTQFTIEERSEALNYLISECIQAGLNTRKFDEIMKGLEESNAKKNNTQKRKG